MSKYHNSIHVDTITGQSYVTFILSYTARSADRQHATVPRVSTDLTLLALVSFVVVARQKVVHGQVHVQVRALRQYRVSSNDTESPQPLTSSPVPAAHTH